MGADFRRGRPDIAPLVKDDEYLETDEHDYMDDDLRAEVGEEWCRGTGINDEEEEEASQHLLTELHQCGAESAWLAANDIFVYFPTF